MNPAAVERQPFRDAVRVLSSLLSPLEKRVLLFLAARLPPWINSDHLTALALAAMFGAGLSFWAADTRPRFVVFVVVCLAINWFGDSLDGTLARVRQHERPRYGYYVDHMVDTLGVLCLFGGLALSGYMNPLLALGVVVAYFMMSIEVYLAAHTLGRFQISYLMLGPTELRIILSAGALWLLVRPSVTILGYSFRLFDIGGVMAIAGLAVILVMTSVAHTKALYLAEPIGRGTGLFSTDSGV
jgi:phosphatidylglycerophosphate synthase